VTQDLSRIRAFVQVYDAGGFSAAARAHGRSKALLSKYVTDLENHLGVRLMNRTTRKLSLTESGDAYYREARSLLQQLDDLDASMADQATRPRGLLRISAPRNFGETTLAPAIFAFLNANEDVSVDLRLDDRIVDVVAEGLDLALRMSSMPDSSLIARKIAETQIIFCASPELVARVGQPKNPDALRNLPCIIDSNMTWQANWRFNENGRVSSVHVDGRVRVNSPIAALEAARAGLGFAAIPSYQARALLESGELVEVLADRPPHYLSLQAVYPHRRHLPAKVRGLIDHLTGWFSDRAVL